MLNHEKSEMLKRQKGGAGKNGQKWEASKMQECLRNVESEETKQEKVNNRNKRKIC